MHRSFLFLITLFTGIGAMGQPKRDASKLIQFSGMVLTSDSLRAVPLTNILIKNSPYGTVSDMNGFFSFVAEKGDTVLFSSIGYKASSYVIPSDLSAQKYSIIKLMTNDTIYLDPVTIHPFINRELFDKVFVESNIPDDKLETARKNLEREKLKEQANAMKMDGAENQKYQQQQMAARYYYAGQVPPMNIMNPFAWAQFFEAWKRGDYKRKAK